MPDLVWLVSLTSEVFLYSEYQLQDFWKVLQ